MSYIVGMLKDEDVNELKDFLKAMIVNETKEAIESFYTEPPANQTEIAKFLKTSPAMIRKYEKAGMPHGSIEGKKFYDRKTCKEWTTTNHIDTLKI